MAHQPTVPSTPMTSPSGAMVDDALSGPAFVPDIGRERLPDFLRAITDNLGEGTYALDTDGRVTFMNPAAERMLGWTEAELRGRDMHTAIHFQHADGTPFPKAECPLLRVLATGQIERAEDDTFTRKDGTRFPVAWVSSPIASGGGATGTVLAFHDISEQQALNEARRRSEREAAARASQLMAIFESMADAMMVYDREGRILRTNAADTALFPAGESIDAVRMVEQRDNVFTYLDEHGRPLAGERRPPPATCWSGPRATWSG
ncbi:MAG TPA: PAS domain S-box protein [Ktedonobacterales bacterium]